MPRERRYSSISFSEKGASCRQKCPSPSAEQGLQDTARGQALQAALDTLPDRQKQAVVLRHLEGLSNPEIAGIMDIGVRAVESLSARGRKALQGLLAPRRAELGYDDD